MEVTRVQLGSRWWRGRAWASPEKVILNEGGQELAHGTPASWCGDGKCGHLSSLDSRRREGERKRGGGQGEARLCPAEEWEGMGQ